MSEEDSNYEKMGSICCKTIIVGDSGVGKTSIIGRYVKKYNPNEKATIGASFMNKQEIIDGKSIMFEIWDTAGQERYRSINSIFYQDAFICILVYDITKKDSFNNLKSYWYNAVKDAGLEKIIFHVAGNKIDLFEDEAVDKEEVKSYCQSINADYSFISAQENSYIDEMFKKIGKQFINSDIFKSISSKKNDKIKLGENDSTNEKKRKNKKCC